MILQPPLQCHSSLRILSCYERGDIGPQNDFCDAWVGTALDAPGPWRRRTFDDGYGFGAHSAGALRCFDTLLIGTMVKNGCEFTIVGKRARKGCSRILRRIIDECDHPQTQHTTGPNAHARCVRSCRDPSMAELGLKAQPFPTRSTLPNLSVIAKVRLKTRHAKSYPKQYAG